MTDKVMPTQVDLMAQCLLFVQEQSAGEWGEKVEREDAEKLFAFVARHASQAHAEGVAEGKLIGARLGLEAAANTLVSVFVQAHDTEWDAGVNCARQLYHDAIRALSPADVVKGGESV